MLVVPNQISIFDSYQFCRLQILSSTNTLVWERVKHDTKEIQEMHKLSELFLHCFQRGTFSESLKVGIVW